MAEPPEFQGWSRSGLVAEILRVRNERDQLREAVNEARPHVYRQMVKAKHHDQNRTDAANWFCKWVDSGLIESYPNEREKRNTRTKKRNH